MLGVVSLLSLLVASQAVLGTAAIGGAVQNVEVFNHVKTKAARASSYLGTRLITLQDSAATQIPASDTPASRHQGYMMGLQSVESFVPTSLLPENTSIVTHSKIYR